jgi:hypothetical protein
VRSTFVPPTLLALLACQPQPQPTDPPAADQPIADQPIADQPAADPGVPVESGQVNLVPFKSRVHVEVGTTLRYSFRSHASVGYGASQRCSNESVVRYVETNIEYEQSEAERAGKTGADAATGTFVFEAVAPGTTTVTVDEEFRGTSETTTTFTIVVTD